MQKTFRTGRTKPYEFRMKQLKNLQRGMKEMKKEMCEALEKDLRKSHFATYFASLWPLEGDLAHTIANLSTWMQDEHRDTAMVFAPATTKVVYEPFGVSLLFGSWNYPYIVTIGPLIGAIAAGNCAVLKPSEMAPASSAAMVKLVNTYLDTDCYRVLEGGVEVAIAIT